MTPEEVIDFLFPYFEDNRLLDKKYYLTSADDLSLGNCNYYKYLPLLRGFADSSLAVDRENGKIVNLLTTEEMLNNLIYQYTLVAFLGHPALYVFCLSCDFGFLQRKGNPYGIITKIQPFRQEKTFLF